MKYFASAFFAATLFISAQAIAAPHESELHYAFMKHCEAPPPGATPAPSPNSAQPTPEPCEPETPFDEQKDAYVFSDFTSDEAVDIDLYIKNPRLEMVTSMRAKLKFDPTKLNIMSLDTDQSDFPLAAPGENDIDIDNGTITIGRSLTGGSLSNEEFFVGTISMMPYTNDAMLEFLNYQNTELGDTGVYFTSGISLENRLTSPPKPLVFGNGSPQQTSSPTPTPDGGNIGGEVTPIPTPIQFPSEDGAFSRPVGLRIQTDEPGNVRLVWPIAEDPPVRGYYLYYGQKSGFYLRRRDVGRTNFAVFPDLNRNEKYFFAITAYNAADNETDYSDEVFVTVGQPGSESHGFLGDPRSPEQMGPIGSPAPSTSPSYNMEGIDKTVDSGPEHVLFFLLISMGFAFIFYAFRKT